MQHMDLVARDKHAYIDLIIRLLWDDVFWKHQSHSILTKFQQNLQQNNVVAIEWVQFILRIVQSSS